VKTLFIGMDDPGNLAAIDDISFRSGLRVQPVLVAPSALCEAIDRFYHRATAALNPLAVEDPPNALSLDGEIRRGAAAGRSGGTVEESLLREVESLDDRQDHDPEIPSEFELDSVVAEPVAPAVALDAARADPSRTILRALCQLLIEKQILGAEELQARVRQIDAE